MVTETLIVATWATWATRDKARMASPDFAPTKRAASDEARRRSAEPASGEAAAVETIAHRTRGGYVF